MRELLAEQDPRTVQPRLHGTLTQAKPFSHLRRRQTLDVAQHQDVPQRGRKSADSLFQRLAQLAPFGGLFGAAAGIAELQDSIVGPALQRLVTRGVPAAPGAGVARDDVGPARQRSVPSKAMERRDQRREGLLHHVLGLMRIAAEPPAKAIKRPGEQPRNLVEGPAVALSGRRDQLAFLLRATTRDPLP